MFPIVMAGPAHPIRIAEDSRTGEPAPYILVRDTLEAKLTRSVFYHLVDLGVEHDTPKGKRFGVWSDGTFFELGNFSGDDVTGYPPQTGHFRLFDGNHTGNDF